MDCLLIDCDGTLVDSEIILAEVLAEIFAEAGLCFGAEDYLRDWRGVALEAIFTGMAEQQDRKLDAYQTRQMEQQLRRRMAREMALHLQPMPGVAKSLDNLPHTKAVVSNGPLEKIRLALDTTGLARHFSERLFSAHELGLFKPDPRIFLASAEKLGIEPGRCVVVEDSPTGIRAGLDAGMKVIHYNRFPQREPTPAGAIPMAHWQQLPSLLRELNSL